jgi:hypothetical protein
MSSPYTSIAASLLPKGLPDDATPLGGAVNATDITTTTKQTIVTATAGKRMFITQASCYNKTTTEDQIIMLRHGTTDIAILHPADIADAYEKKGGMVTFDPPLIVPAGVDLDGIGVIALVGDCVVFVNGYSGT